MPNRLDRKTLALSIVALWVTACGSDVYNNSANRSLTSATNGTNTGSVNSNGTNGSGSGSGSTPNGGSGGNPNPPPYEFAQALDFGGMYGGYYNVAGGYSAEYVNPITNASTCPLGGYVASTVTGTPNLDYGIGLCSRPHVTGREEEYDYGGSFGYVDGGVLSPNPVTGAASCPAGYTQVTVHGSANLDWSMYFCYRRHVPGQPGAAKFGGFFGYGWNGGLVTFVNPATNGAICPPGYTQHRLLGTNGLDWSVFGCLIKM